MVQGNLNELNNSVKVGMFNLQDGRNVSELNADDRSQVRAVIALVDEEKRYAVGLCPVRLMLPFSFSCLSFRTEGILSGREATKILLEEAAKQGVELPVAEFCVNFDKNGVAKGEAFLPSAKELKQFPLVALQNAWHKIGLADCHGTMWSSTINWQDDVWVASFNPMAVGGWRNQYLTFGLMPAIEIAL